MISSVCICGAGTMGSGIARVFAQNGFATILFDIDAAVLDSAKRATRQALQYLVDKHRIAEEELQNTLHNLNFTNDVNDCKADLIIEAIIEKADPKIALFTLLATLNGQHTIFATNTSSLSVSAIQKNVAHPERIVGLHFFNPAPVMKLVEVIKGSLSADTTVETVLALCKRINKIAVICKDAPGFIVNRVARHYYLEALRLVEEGNVRPEDVDIVMEATGFKMGPFKLMDLIGLDINLSVTQGIYEAFDKADRFKPSSIQIEKVKNGDLGKKTGKGFYQYPTNGI